MNTNRGIFDSFPNQAAGRQDSPFSVAAETEQAAIKESPFTVASERPSSPFTVVDEGADSKSTEFGKPVKIPERRKVDSPFQVAEPSEGFGFEAATPAPAASPFEAAAAFPAYPPLSTPVQPLAASPFSVEAQPAASSFETPADSAFKPWHESAASPAQAPAATPAHIPSAFAPAPAAPQAAVTTQAAAHDFQSDSSSIRQLELRAIFGVDRELSADEILQRARALPGIRGLARVGPREMVTVEGLKHLLTDLGFHGGPLKLYTGSTPLEFIREGPVLLAVQTDGSYAPGVRETLMIVARELGRIA
ncbi:MAG: hypothetical protein Q8Q59_05185 [Luteolibacter sp.]|nr:hypothetical protein [Luteolibacter sp.]